MPKLVIEQGYNNLRQVSMEFSLQYLKLW